VPSQKGKGSYLVSIDPNLGSDWRCECEDFEARQLPCKHVHAVQFTLEREKNASAKPGLPRKLSLSNRVTLAKATVAERPTYKQAWTSYNRAQTNEKPKFQALLHDLCKIIEEAPQEGAGRPRVPLRDIVYGATYKVYSMLSGRRFMGDLMEAQSKGYISQAAHYNTTAKYMEMPDLGPILQALIARSALPLKSVESDFAIDSSGFASSRFVRWFDKKYGVVKEEHDWVKAHVSTGIKTNVVTAANVDEHYSADSPHFVPLLRATAAGFRIGEMSADAAYCAYENFDAVAECGGTPYIAFKANTTAAQGGTFEKMYHLFSLNREDYADHYHKRSNIESTFSSIKAKFGDSVRSKTPPAMKNEVLAKILCHNICCVINATYELGVVATFFGPDEPEPEIVAENGSIDAGMEAWDWV
jgi:transposase